MAPLAVDSTVSVTVVFWIIGTDPVGARGLKNLLLALSLELKKKKKKKLSTTRLSRLTGEITECTFKFAIFNLILGTQFSSCFILFYSS